MAPTRLRIEESWVADLDGSGSAMHKRIVIDRVLPSNLGRVDGCVGLALLGSEYGKARMMTSVMIHLDKVGQNAIPVPSGVAQCSPCIVVVLTASIPTHGIQDTATAKNLALGHRAWCSVQLGLWGGGEEPVVDATNVCSNVDRVLDDGFITVTGDDQASALRIESSQLTGRPLQCREH